MATNAIDVSRVAPSEGAEPGTPLTLQVDPDRLGREAHKHLTPEHPVVGCVLCETEVPSTFFVQLKPCCGAMLGDVCECGPGEFGELFEQSITWDLRNAA